MELSSKGFGQDELTALKLRGLFERRGFKRVRVNKFEDYSLYVDNKNFLQSDSVITFMDLSGKLLALKPDVTLSVVRSVPQKELPVLEKLYYVDEVYRLSREEREYRARSQIGVEIIGRPDRFSNMEAVDLALSSLALISERFVLNVSHLGFVSGLLEQMELSHSAKARALGGIHAKSPHDVAAALDSAGAAEEDRARVLALCGIHGGFMESVAAARKLVTCERMAEACRELEELGEALWDSGAESHMKLDFSVVNDLDYYNGLIFLGYAEELPRVVLTGGRYDNLMRKMGKNNGAIGFAVSLDDIGIYLKTGKRFDFDMLVTYPEDCDYGLLLPLVRELSERGVSVRLESEGSNLDAAGFTWARRCRFDGNGLEGTEAGIC